MTQFAASQMMETVWSVSHRLKAAGIWHEIRGYREDSISVVAVVPGAYWEIDVLDDSSIDVEEFKSTGILPDPGKQIDRLIESQTSI